MSASTFSGSKASFGRALKATASVRNASLASSSPTISFVHRASSTSGAPLVRASTRSCLSASL